MSDFLSNNQLRLAGSYGGDEYAGMQNRYSQTLPKFAADQATLDEATQAKQDFDKAWTQLDLAFDKAAIKLAPTVTKLVDEVADWVSAFGGSKQFDSDVQGFKTAVAGLANAAERLESLFKWAEKIDHSQPGDQSQLGHGAWDLVKNYATGHFGEAWKDLNKPVVETNYDGYTDDDTSPGAGPGAGTGTGAGNSGYTTSADFEAKMLHAIEMNESHGVNGQTNPVSGAAGLMQITPENYRKAGIDPMDPVANRALGKKIYEGFLHKYQGDPAKAAAAYDGFGGLDADIKKYGDKWRDHIGEYQTSGETIEYLKRLERQGIDLSPQQQQAQANTKPNATKFDKPQVVPFVAPKSDDFSAAINDQPQDAGDTAALKAQMKQAMDGFTDFFAPGAGAKYFHDDQQQAKPVPFQQAPIQISVQTNQLPGHSTNVAAGSLASW